MVLPDPLNRYHALVIDPIWRDTAFSVTKKSDIAGHSKLSQPSFMNIIFAGCWVRGFLFLGLPLDYFLFRFSLRAPKSWRAELGNAKTQKLRNCETQELASECFSALAAIALLSEPAISLKWACVGIGSKLAKSGSSSVANLSLDLSFAPDTIG